MTNHTVMGTFLQILPSQRRAWSQGSVPPASPQKEAWPFAPPSSRDNTVTRSLAQAAQQKSLKQQQLEAGRDLLPEPFLVLAACCAVTQTRRCGFMSSLQRTSAVIACLCFPAAQITAVTRAVIYKQHAALWLSVLWIYVWRVSSSVDSLVTNKEHVYIAAFPSRVPCLHLAAYLSRVFGISSSFSSLVGNG